MCVKAAVACRKSLKEPTEIAAARKSPAVCRAQLGRIGRATRHLPCDGAGAGAVMDAAALSWIASDIEPKRGTPWAKMFTPARTLLPEAFRPAPSPVMTTTLLVSGFSRCSARDKFQRPLLTTLPTW